MNPVVVLLLALNGALQLVMTSPVALYPFASWSSRLGTAELRTRSLPQSTGNHAAHPAGKGSVNSKVGNIGLSEVGVEVLLGLLAVERSWTGAAAPTVKVSTTESPLSATVDIETLPGYWLKDPSRIEESTGTPYGVDYRTERYRLDDLLNKKLVNQ